MQKNAQLVQFICNQQCIGVCYVAAQNGKRMHKIVSGKLIGTSEKLSSGYRVNRAADDAAGLSISEKMRFQIRGLDRGSANINEGIGYYLDQCLPMNNVFPQWQRLHR